MPGKHNTMEAHKLLAGAAKVEITPPLGTIINGDYVMHYARYIHDPLYAKALVLRSGSDNIAIMVVDICAMDKQFLDDVKLDIQKQTGIPATHILISSTHTHAAGSIMSLLLSPADLPYRQKLPGLLTQAVVQAYHNLQEAKIGFGSVEVPEYLRCRRYKMNAAYTPSSPVNGQEDQTKTNPFGLENLIEAPTTQPDPEVGYLAVQSAEGKWISLLANYSLHYVGDWENGTLTADYFGEFASYLQKALSADEGFVGIMSNGTSGEVNIWDFQNSELYPKEHFAKSRLIGSDIARKVALSIKDIHWQSQAELAVRYATVLVAVRKPSLQELSIAQEKVKQINFEKPTTDEQGLIEIYAREQIMLNEYADNIAFPVQAIRIGKGIIGALGGEFFSETGLSLRKESGIAHYFTITLANDYVGYVPPAHELEKGGYETWRCRTSCLEANAEHMIRTELLKFIQSLK